MTQSVEYIKRDETSEENESQLVWFDKNLNKLPNHLITEETSTTEVRTEIIIIIFAYLSVLHRKAL